MPVILETIVRPLSSITHSDNRSKLASEKLKEKISSSDNLTMSSSESKVRKSDFLKDFEQVQENTKLLEKENVDLKEKINFERKMLTDSENRIKSCELKNRQLLKQISDFEQVLVLERVKFEKERTEFQTERKVFETKSAEFSLKISGLEKILAKEVKEFEYKKNGFEKKKTEMLSEFSVKVNELEKELEDGRKEIEKKKVDGFKEKCLKDDFEREKKVFHCEIKKLTKKLSDLSTNIMKEQLIKSDLQKKYDLIFKENNVLINKVKELEDIVFKVDVSKQTSPDTVDQTPFANSTHSECSFKTASSSIFKDTKVFNKSNHSSKDQILSSNLFYDPLIDKSDNCSFKKVKMEWRVKGTIPKKKVPNSKVPNSNVKKNNTYQGKSFVKPDVIYSINQLVRFAQKKLCCSYCGTDDFVNKRYIQHWFGSYRISSYVTTPNKPGPKFNWVPKSI